MDQTNVAENPTTTPLPQHLQKLIIVRHGEYSRGTDQLNDEGKQQMVKLCEKLKSHINSGPILMFSSTEDRAWQSADILSATFKVPYEKHKILEWGDRSGDRQAVIELIRSHAHEAEIIILVTHLEYTRYFPCHFTQEFLGSPLGDDEGVYKGEALVIDCPMKQIRVIDRNQ